MMKQISIWLGDDVPSELADIIPKFWETREPVEVVAHVPSHILKDPLYEIAASLPPRLPNAQVDPRIRWFSESGMGLFGSNHVDFIEHPKGDGYIIVFRFI